MNAQTIKFIDAYIVRFLVKILAYFHRKSAYRASNYDFTKVERILIIRPGGAGDAILLSPLLAYLEQQKKQVDVLAMKSNFSIIGLFKEVGLVHDIFRIDRFGDVFHIWKHLSYDLIIDTEQSFYTSALYGFLFDSQIFIGFDTNERRNLYDSFVSYKQGEYEAQSFMNLLRPFDIQLPYTFPTDRIFSRFPECETPIRTVIEKISGKRNLVIFVGANVSYRRWPKEKWGELIRKSQKSFDHIICIGGGDIDQEIEYIREHIPEEKFVSLAGKIVLGTQVISSGQPSYMDTMRALEHSSVCISNDSGPLHLAVLAGVKNIIGIFGPGIKEKWGGPYVDVVRIDTLACIGCNEGRFSQTPPCPYKYRCIRDLEVQKVFFRLQSYL